MSEKSKKQFWANARKRGREKLVGEDLQLHMRFSEYGGNAKEWLRKCALMLPEIERRKIWKKKGCTCIYEYAAKLAGMSKHQVRESLRVLRNIEDKPALRRVVEEKGINAVRPIAAIATVENQEFWAEKAGKLTVRELEIYAGDKKRELNEQNNRYESHHVVTAQPVKVTVTMELDSETANQLKKMQANSGDWEEVMKKLLKIRKEQLEQQKPEPVQTETRSIPKKIEKFVEERDSGTCVVPGCMEPCQELHHTEGFAKTKTHDPDTIRSVCKGHHDLSHRGLIQNEHKPPQYWRLLEESDGQSSRFGLDRLVGQHRNFGRVAMVGE